METDWRQRTRMLIGADNLEKLKGANIIVLGVGGVGGFCAEALIRAGVGKLTVVDFDVVDITNLNRQIIALRSTLGRSKVSVLSERAKDINPDIQINPVEKKVKKENISEFCLSQFDYIIDAIDDVGAKLLLISEAKRLGVPVISSMGTGNKKDPSQFRIADIAKTHTCPLAKTMRKELARMGIAEVKVLFSAEKPEKAEEMPGIASISYNPAAAGLLIAAEVLKEIMK